MRVFSGSGPHGAGWGTLVTDNAEAEQFVALLTAGAQATGTALTVTRAPPPEQQGADALPDADEHVGLASGCGSATQMIECSFISHQEGKGD